MKKITLVLALGYLALFNFNFNFVRAQGTASAPAAYVDPDTIPIVPADIQVKGRAEVIEYLKRQIDHVNVAYGGQSMIQSNFVSLSTDQLKQLGYVHAGSFVELADAISQVQFSAPVMQTPDGYYRVGCTIQFQSADNRTLFSGTGWLNISQNSDGTLSVGQFNPWISLADVIGMPTSNTVYAARWAGKYQASQSLPIAYGSSGNPMIEMPTDLLGAGYLLTADSQTGLSGINLVDGSALSGQQVSATLGRFASPDVIMMRDPKAIAVSQQGPIYATFTQYGSLLYGRFPLIDLAVSKGFHDNVTLNVPIWNYFGNSGYTAAALPSHVYVTPLFLKGGLVAGQEYELPISTNGVFVLDVPAGEYSIRAVFDGLIDQNAPGAPPMKG